jgi:hypothetical protein
MCGLVPGPTLIPTGSAQSCGPRRTPARPVAGDAKPKAAEAERFFSLWTEPGHTDPSRTRYGL